MKSRYKRCVCASLACLWLQEVCGTVPLCLCDELSRSPSCNAFETSPIPIVIVVVANFIINVVSTCILYTSLLCLGCLERHPFAWKWFQFVEIIFVLKFKGRSYPVMCATVKRCVFSTERIKPVLTAGPKLEWHIIASLWTVFIFPMKMILVAQNLWWTKSTYNNLYLKDWEATFEWVTNCQVADASKQDFA